MGKLYTDYQYGDVSCDDVDALSKLSMPIELACDQSTNFFGDNEIENL